MNPDVSRRRIASDKAGSFWAPIKSPQSVARYWQVTIVEVPFVFLKMSFCFSQSDSSNSVCEPPRFLYRIDSICSLE